MSDPTVQAAAYNILAAALKTVADANSLSVAWPNVAFTPGATRIWLECQALPNAPDDRFLSNADDPISLGIFQVMVAYREGAGAVLPMQLAGTIADAFDRGTRLTKSGITGEVMVDRWPYIAPPIQDEGILRLPITIMWRFRP